MQPTDRALDDPALRPEHRAVLALGPSDLRLDVPTAQLTASLARVLGPVAVERVRTTAWPAATATHRRNRVHQRQHLRDVVAVAAGERGGERRATSAGDYVM